MPYFLLLFFFDSFRLAVHTHSPPAGGEKPLVRGLYRAAAAAARNGRRASNTSRERSPQIEAVSIEGPLAAF